MKNVLITGSETFGKYITNPTKWLALTVDGTIFENYKIHSLIFPSVAFVPEGAKNPGEIIVKKAEDLNVEMIISFGMVSNVKGFRLERSGTNWIYDEKYLSASENNQPLDPERPEKEQIQADLSYWNIEKMQELFTNAGIPFESKISDDPGQYSCNHWIYRTLLALKRKKLTIPYLFVHTACTEESIELIQDFDRKNKLINKKEDLLKAFDIILKSFKNPA